MAANEFGELLRRFRTERRLTQLQFAEHSGIARDTVASYEAGRRVPDAAGIERLQNGLKLQNGEYDALRRAAGLRGTPSRFEAALKKARGAPESVWDEVQDSEWVTMVLNERREIVAWNRLANSASDLDLASLTQFRRSILRMAATEHYERHLTNWDELIGRLISIFKVEGSDMSAGQSAQFIQAVIESIGREEHERFLQRIFGLFVSAPAWQEEWRNVHPIKWRLDNGTRLNFHGAFADWNLYDGMWAFDWHAADAETATWVQEELASPGGESVAPPAPPFAPHLAASRKEMRLSRPKLEEISGVDAASIRAYESGTRSPSKQSLMALCRALNIDGYATNRFLREAGHDEEPSDWARWLAGDTPISIYKDRTPLEDVGLSTLARGCDALPWPGVLLDAGCHIMHANPLAERLVGLASFEPLPGRPGPHLMQLMVSSGFLENVRNWDTVAGVILPGRLAPLVLGSLGEPSASNVVSLSKQLRRINAPGLERLANIWDSSPGYSSLRRPGVRFEWTTSEGDELTFNCVIAGVTASDPYKSLDLYPADAATFAWMERG